MRNNAQQVSLKFNFCDVELIVNQFQEELLKKIDVFKLDTTQDSNLLIAEVHIVEELRYKQNSAQNKSMNRIRIDHQRGIVVVRLIAQTFYQNQTGNGLFIL